MYSLPFLPAHTVTAYTVSVSFGFVYATECLHQQVHGLLACACACVGVITGGCFSTALGLQWDIGAQTD